MIKKYNYGGVFSQDSSVGSVLDWYLEGPGFKSCRLQLNCQLQKGCGRDSKQKKTLGVLLKLGSKD